MPRYLLIVETDENNVPDEALIERMDALVEEMTEAGVITLPGGVGGLKPTADATRVRMEGGDLAVTDGPFTETKEVVGGYVILQTEDRAGAVEWASRFLKVHEGWTMTGEIREIRTA
ncbi:YciI family protein [Streptomyces sp. NPDC050560]|uniref:YciI family protein n=1 Tax=Streptomyces sp. NPDC050560 TaxID=3365630 RepID=UPI0037A3D4B8